MARKNKAKLLLLHEIFPALVIRHFFTLQKKEPRSQNTDKSIAADQAFKRVTKVHWKVLCTPEPVGWGGGTATPHFCWYMMSFNRYPILFKIGYIWIFDKGAFLQSKYLYKFKGLCFWPPFSHPLRAFRWSPAPSLKNTFWLPCSSDF